MAKTDDKGATSGGGKKGAMRDAGKKGAKRGVGKKGPKKDGNIPLKPPPDDPL